ncbi:MAG: phosphoenolpyruvate kinase [Myxococcota bacterium]
MSTLEKSTVDAQLSRLNDAWSSFHRRYPGDEGRRQPIHTVYGGAQIFKAETGKKLGSIALRSLEAYAPDAATFAEALGLPGDAALHEKVYARMRQKLEREAVEDFRIDFEDGYGNRSDEEEDGHAKSAAAEVARGMKEGTLPPFLGIRIKPLTPDLQARSVRTLDLFLSTLLDASDNQLPENFVVTLPKVGMPEEVEALSALLSAIETKRGLDAGALKLELMVETTQAIVAPDGAFHLPRLVAAADGRCTGAHFGTYDYTALYEVTARYQGIAHPACDFAKHAMKVSLTGTGVMLSDGATNIMPVPVHGRPKDGGELTDAQKNENRAAVYRAWRLHADHVRHALTGGFYQGWDLHPAQLPVRYGATYAFFLEDLDVAGERLSNFIGKAAQATLAGDVFDDAATGQGLLNYFLRATSCGAIDMEEAVKRGGLTHAELESRSFLKILAGRKS